MLSLQKWEYRANGVPQGEGMGYGKTFAIRDGKEARITDISMNDDGK